MGLAMLLVRRTTATPSGDRAPVDTASVGAGLHALLTAAAVDGATRVVAVCADCAASHALVRVLHRRQQHGHRLPRMTVVTDRRWPLLDSLVRNVTGSRLLERPRLHAHLTTTPVAITTGGARHATTPGHRVAIGVHAVVALLTGGVPPDTPTTIPIHAIRAP